MMTRQEMADFVVEKLAGQNFVQSIEINEGDERCAYRGVNGLRCAIGHMIPDDIYKKDFEGEAAETLVCNYPEVSKYLECSDDNRSPYCNVWTATKLQIIHDSCDIPQDMIESLRIFYLKNNLDTTKFEQIVLDYNQRNEKEGE